MCRFGKKARRPGRGIHIGMYTSGMDVLCLARRKGCADHERACKFEMMCKSGKSM